MDEISNIKFNLTPLMAEEIVKINELKIKLLEIEDKISKACDDIQELIDERERLVNEIDIQKKKFIKEFQNSNKKQISKYLDLKNKDN